MKKHSPIDKELAGMAHYLQMHWTYEGSFFDVIELVADKTQNEVRHAFDALDLGLAIDGLKKERIQEIRNSFDDKIKKDLIRYFDSTILTLEQLDHHAHFIASALLAATHYESVCKRILKSVLATFPRLKESRPVVVGFDLQDALGDFKGDKSLPSRSAHFVERVSNDYTDYQHKDQGRHPVYTLISAIYGHLVNSQIKANTQSMIDEIEIYARSCESTPVFGLPHVFTHPSLQMIERMKDTPSLPTEKDFLLEVGRVEAFQQLPEHERQRRGDANAQSLLADLDVTALDEMNAAAYRKAADVLDREWGIRAFIPDHTANDISL